MQYRTLGRTGLQVSELGLGSEYLSGVPRATVAEIIAAALECGVNYFDIVFAFPEFRDNLAAALQAYRDQIILPAHLGSGAKDGHYQRTRNLKECEALFHDQLTRFGTDHVDVLLLHNVASVGEWEELIRPKGLLDLAHRLVREGKARFIGVSAHDVPTALRAVRSDKVDVLMVPANLAAHAQPGRKDLFNVCAGSGVGIVAMKPFAGGKLFQQRSTTYIAGYMTGGRQIKRKIPPTITPVQCLSYVLAQPAVATVVPGVKSSEELSSALSYVDAGTEARDYAEALASFQDYISHECVYCNHCLPCPENIDIGEIGRLVDLANSGALDAATRRYQGLKVKASACTECLACVPRCPFGVDIIDMLWRAVDLFERPADDA